MKKFFAGILMMASSAQAQTILCYDSQGLVVKTISYANRSSATYRDATGTYVTISNTGVSREFDDLGHLTDLNIIGHHDYSGLELAHMRCNISGY